MDWFFLNPVLEGYISYADLKNGTLNLYDLYLLNRLIEYKGDLREKSIRDRAVNKAINSKKV